MPMAPHTARKSGWAQPSLSRDFALLSAAILFVMLLISAWVAWITYIKHSERVVAELEQETDRIERLLSWEIQNTGHLLNAIGKQIAVDDAKDYRRIAQLLQTFSTGNPQYAIWSWSDPMHRVVVSSNKGVLEEPVSIDDRDYATHTQESPWKIYVGDPVEGRVSGRWIIPVSIGITSDTGEYIGALTASLDIGTLTANISHLVQRDGISFTVMSKSFVPLTITAEESGFAVGSLPIDRLKDVSMEEESKGVMSQASFFPGMGIYSYYLISGKYPYIIVVGYDNETSESAIRHLLWPRMIQIGVVAGFLLAFLWIIRSRVIRPVVELGNAAAHVARGNDYHSLRTHGPLEIEELSYQLGLISDYIAERRLLEEELRSKIIHLHSRMSRVQMEVRQRSVLLAGLLAEYKKSLRSINSQAQVLKDQLYGPIEEKRYRQYAADIHQTGTTLELMMRKLIALSRVDASAVITRDEMVKLSALIEGAKRFVAEALEGQEAFSLQLPEGVPPEIMLQLDGLHTQQAIAYVMLYLVIRSNKPVNLSFHLLTLSTVKGKEIPVLLIGRGNAEALTPTSVQAALNKANSEALRAPSEEHFLEHTHIALAQAMLDQQHINLAVLEEDEASLWVAISFPEKRVMSVEKV